MVIFVQQEYRGPCQLQASPHRLFDRTRHHHRRLQVGATWLGLLWYSQGALWPCWHPLHWRDYLHLLLPRSWFLVLVQAFNWRRFDPYSPPPPGGGREVKAEVAFHTRVWLGERIGLNLSLFVLVFTFGRIFCFASLKVVNARVLAFFSLLFCFGVEWGTEQTFYFVYANEELGATISLLGIMGMANPVTSLIM